jgi:NAD(P)-dependent dehydrogenase (short-subunit alcohol dehydrogenase family)
VTIDLSGQLALVTASTAGIGLAIAHGLAGAGAQVIVNGRTQARCDAAVRDITSSHPGAVLSTFAGDLGDVAQIDRLIAAFPRCDLLINNLALFEIKKFLELADDDWQRFFNVNLMCGVRLSRAYLPAMMAARKGRIVFSSSTAGTMIPTELIHYGAFKAALLAVSRGLAQVAAGTGVTVNSVLPGLTRSEGVANMLDHEAAARGTSVEAFEADLVSRSVPATLIGRLILPEEVAGLVVYLCSAQAAATTGAALRVDGGVLPQVF